MDTASLVGTVAGILALVLGVSAIAGAVGGIVMGGRGLSHLEKTLRLALDLLTGVAISLEKAGSAARCAGGSIDEANQSLVVAARMGNQAASALVGIGSLADVRVLGIHPLRGLREMLASEGHEIGLMADQLLVAAESMGKDANNMREMADDLEASGRQVKSLVSRLEETVGPPGSGLFRKIIIGLYFLNAWFLGLGVMLVLLGIALIE